MKVTPLVSIIIPAYNADKYLSLTLSSALSQSYNTKYLLSNFVNPKLKVFSISNSGQCAAANFGLKKSRGEYIKFLDADDLLDSNHIESMLSVAIENSGDLVLCKWARFFDNIEDAYFSSRPEWGNFESSMDWFKVALSNGPDMLPVWQWLIPKKVIDISGGWDESLGLGNDFEFSSRLLVASKGIKYCGSACVYYRSGLKENMSNNTSLKTYMSVLEAIHKSRSVILEKSVDKDLKVAFASKYFFWLISYYPHLKAEIVIEIENIITELGEVNFSYEWGWKYKLVKSFLGWKKARMLQYYYSKLINTR
jgi:glycosyltransferase involved in cell wall biosynthesis